MLRSLAVCLVSVSLFAHVAVRAAADEKEKALANSLADSASDFKKAGKMDQARLYFFKALFHDEACAEALYQLGQIYESQEDKANAVNFFERANQEFGKAGDPVSRAKSKDCERHILRLSPYTTQLNTAMEDYATDLGRIAAKNSDTLTLDEAQSKVTALNLPQFVAAEKMPDALKNLTRPKPAAKTPTTPNMRRSFDRSNEAPVVSNVPPDVERTLKASGWTTITGTWKKKSDGVYEVTDGKCEAKIANGIMQVIVGRGGSGVVRMFCRNENHEYAGDMMSSREMGSYATGFGYIIKDNEAKQYMPTGGWTDMDNNNMPYVDKVNTLTLPKNRFIVQVTDNKLEITINGLSPRKTNSKITHDGPFTIQVVGTATIEMPQVKGF